MTDDPLPVLPATLPFELPLDGGEVLRGDELPGATPGYVYLHGLGSVRTGQKSNSLLLHAQARGRAFLRVDLRGHGESSGTIGRVTIVEMIADVRRVLARMERCTLIGSSLGGLLAAFASVEDPERIERLCLLAPALGLMANLGHRLDADGRMQTSNGMSFRVEPHVLASARRLDENGLPGRITVPTLLVHGTADEVVPHGASERFFAAIPHPHKDLWIVPDGDHRLVDQAPTAWHRLDRLPTPPHWIAG